METGKRFKVTITDNNKTRSIDIDKESCTLGRSGSADIPLNNELISRVHLKISLQNEVLIVEEMGSSNGSWLNGARLEAGKKVVYREDSLLHLGSQNGIQLKIKNLSVSMKAAQSNDATLIRAHAIPTITKKVANGGEVIIPVHPTPTLKIVKDEPPKNNKAQKPTLASPDELQKSLENHVKLLANQESQKLREAALKEVNEIRQEALKEKDQILLAAKEAASQIVGHANSISESINEKNKKTQAETENATQALKTQVLQYEEKVKHLKEEEKNHLRKIKSCEEKLSAIEEKSKQETLNLLDLKDQASNIKKSFDAKMEEIIFEERRVRAKLEVEIAEARAQVSKIQIEVEKGQTQRDLLFPEIQQLRSDKDRIDREINEAQISYRRIEYDLERITKEQEELEAQGLQAKADYDAFLKKFKSHKESQLAQQKKIDEHEKFIQEKIDGLEDFANQAKNDAHVEASRIIKEAQASAALVEEEKQKVIRDLDLYKENFLADLEKEKASLKKKEHDELAQIKLSAKSELDKLEQKKISTVSEIKWLEEDAKKKSSALIEQAKKDIESMKAEKLKALHSEREKSLLEIAAIKESALSDAAVMKDETQMHCLRLKQQAEAVLMKANEKVEERKAKLDAQLQKNIEVQKALDAALLKTEALIDDNYLEANQKIKAMIEKAKSDAVDIERSAMEIKASMINSMAEYKQIEMEKINALKKAEHIKLDEIKSKADNYTTISLQERADSISKLVEHFLTQEMTKSKRLIVDDKIIARVSKKTKEMVVDAINEEYEPIISDPSKPFSKKPKRKIKKTIVFIAIGLAIYGLNQVFPDMVPLIISEIKRFMITQNISTIHLDKLQLALQQVLSPLS